ncbi:MAG: cysteine desulfurase [Actinomycetes bacterium]|jgi:cysteine desulfurase|nr:cysteine desulfurase [Actinomycetes bacterium]
MTKYLDYAATTPVDERVIEVMLPYFNQEFGNPNSLYKIGRDAFHALEAARETVATGIGAERPGEVIFTSGGTEADNESFFSVLRAKAPNGGHLIVSAYEHHAVLRVAEWLAKHGFELSIVKPRKDGHVYAEDVAKLLREDTKLVSVMHSNNEIGAVNDIAAIAEVVHGADALMHTDAVQSLGKVELNVARLGVDMASFSSHKIYGPKGVGALYLKRGIGFDALIKGGGQETRRRSGTQNVAGAIGFAKALELMLAERETEAPRLIALRDRALEGVTTRLENTLATIHEGERLPNIAPLLIKGVEGESMLLQLDNLGFSVSTGSACSSGSLEPSHVLLSVGVAQEIAHGSLRISVGRWTTQADIDEFVDVLVPIVERLRAMSPVYEKMFCS